MKVLIIEPEKHPKVKEIGEGLSSLQMQVGGMIEAIYPFEDEVAIICNEEGKNIGLPLNRALWSDGQLYDIIAGTFLVVGLTEENFGSLSEELIERYRKRFYHPELFMNIGGKLRVIPI